SISVSQVWSAALVAVALMKITGCSLTKAVFAAIVYAAITIVFTAALAVGNAALQDFSMNMLNQGML
ncbi:MAG: hypothetical protein LBS21_14925, partial [Clostridiales bacterium]|nr:hypothetical protein [Clostridiales bacterium]